MDDTDNLDEATLLGYLLGDATPSVRAHLARSPAARAALAQLAQQLTRLYRLDCPAPSVLVTFQERRIADSALHLSIHRHAAACPHCSAELALLAQVDAVPLATPPWPTRRVIEAAFQSPLSRVQTLRGDLLFYATPSVAVHLRVRQEDKPGAWTLRGQLRGADGQRPVDLLEAAHAHSQTGETRTATVEQQGAFRFTQLTAGIWTLALQTTEEAITIRNLTVGNDDAVLLP